MSLPKGVTRVIDKKTGKAYHQDRRGKPDAGPRTTLPEYGTSEFWKALAGLTGETRTPANTIASLKVFAALAFVEGEAKYGGHNWRAAGVLSSVYKAAMERHMESWWNGEDNDPRTGTPHLASVIACAGIILDAELGGKLKDDRPPCVDYASLMASLEPKVAAIREQFAGRNPKHYTAVSEAEDRQAAVEAGLDQDPDPTEFGGIDRSPNPIWRRAKPAEPLDLNSPIDMWGLEQTGAWRNAPEAPKPKFKVGDRVRCTSVCGGSTFKIGEIYTVSLATDNLVYVQEIAVQAMFPCRFELVEPKPFQIEAGKFYRTRGGDKVGPMKDWLGGRFIVKEGDGRTWSASGAVTDRSGLKGSHYLDLVAEWVDSPDASIAGGDFELASARIRPEPTMVEDLHGYCGSDAARWAEQFRLMAIKLGYSDMDEGWLIGWFANAIERAIQVRHPPALPDYLTPAPSTNEAPR